MNDPIHSEDARRLWAIADQVRAEAHELRAQADCLDVEAKRLSRLAEAILNDEPLAKVLA